MKEIVIEANEAGQRLDKYLKKALRSAPTGTIYKLIRKKHIKLNSKKAKENDILCEGDTLCFYLSDDTLYKFGAVWLRPPADTCVVTDTKNNKRIDNARFEKIDIRYIYEDDDIALIDKPKGVLSQKAAYDDISINEIYIQDLMSRGIWDASKPFTPSVCNRLDRNTSGIVLAGKSYKGLRILSDIIKKRTIKKYYLAIADSDALSGISHPTGEWIDISYYIKKDHKANKVSIVSPDDGCDHTLIKTRYKIVASDEHTSLIEAEIITGKTHQIRAGLSFEGLPLTGDVKYGGSRQDLGYMLHAYKVVFPMDEALPYDLQAKTFICKPPDYMESQISKRYGGIRYE